MQSYTPQQFLNPARSQPLASMPANHLRANIARAQMIATLASQQAIHPQVLQAMASVPRHVFVDEGFQRLAYEDTALPIGYQQTISHPSSVATMLSLACGQQQDVSQQHWLEIGTGCGYQAAVMANCVAKVYSIERITGLHALARRHLTQLGLHNIELRLQDGQLAWMQACADAVPRRFDAIVVAAAGIEPAPAWLAQLAVGACLVAPLGSSKNNAQAEQTLRVIQRTSETSWLDSEHGQAYFVPICDGVQA